MKFGILAKPELENIAEIVNPLIEFLKKNNQEFYLEKKTADKLSIPDGIPIYKMKVDVLITIGGDGTILRALQQTSAKIFGIQAGVLGFLTEASPKDAVKKLNRILCRDYTVDSRIKLKVVLNKKRLPDCTNEATIHTAEIAKMRKFKIIVNGQTAQNIRADGIIVSTPTGSTSYSMSVGGPIIDPQVKALLISPIAPFKLSARSLVVAGDANIKVQIIDGGKKCLLVLDGQKQYRVFQKDNIEFTISEISADFIRFDENFYKKVAKKLNL